MAKNVAVGILRPPHIFFYEVDVKKGQFRKTREKLKKYIIRYFRLFAIYRSLHGYHIISYGYTKNRFQKFRRKFKSDFTRRLKPRWKRKEPQVLRISEKFDLKTGKVVSPKPKLVYGNFFLENIQKYKVMYYAK